MNTLLERAMLFVLFLSIIFSALAQGVVDAWSIGILECLSGLLLLLWVSKTVIGGNLKVVMPQVILPILAFFLLGLLHCLAFTGKDGAVASLSSDVEATRKTVFLFFFLIIDLLVSIQLFHSKKRLVVTVNFLVVYGLAMAMFALIQHFTWNGKFYWLKPNKQSVSPFGPFVSHNHFAGYMEMLIPLALALMWKRDARTEARLFYGFAGLVMSVATIASLSRGGMLSLGALLVFLIIGKWQRRQSTRKSERRSSSGASSSSRQAMEVAHRQNVPAGARKRPRSSRTLVPTFLKGALATGAVALALLVGMVWVGPDRVSNRLSSGKLVGDNQNNETFYSSRGWIWKDSWKMIKAHPLFGVGIGAYETAYPIYSSSNGAIVVGQTHNDYLQVLADAGIIGGALAVWFIFQIWREIWLGIALRDATLSVIALGSGAGIFAILIHSFLDFNLQLPSNILLFFILVAIVAQSVAIAAVQERKGLESGRQLQQLPESSAKAIHLPI